MPTEWYFEKKVVVVNTTVLTDKRNLKQGKNDCNKLTFLFFDVIFFLNCFKTVIAFFVFNFCICYIALLKRRGSGYGLINNFSS